MSPSKASIKPVTPGSVKVLMIVEAGVIGFLSLWLLNEYFYNAYFRTYIDLQWVANGATYSSILGIGMGLVGSAVAATLYRNLRSAKRRLETVATPRIKGAVDKLLSNLPTLDDQSPLSKLKLTATPAPATQLSVDSSSVGEASNPSLVKKDSS